jgi:hypothetical protein
MLAPVFAEAAELCDAGADGCVEDADFGEAAAADSSLVAFFADVTAPELDAESALTAESASAAGARSSVFVQEQTSSAAGRRTLRRMQSCV